MFSATAQSDTGRMALSFPSSAAPSGHHTPAVPSVSHIRVSACERWELHFPAGTAAGLALR
jgi:hypothetical protein